TTQKMGSHNLIAGYDEFHELRNENNYQSGSDFRFFGPFMYVNGKLFVGADPTVVGTATRSRIQWDPLLAQSQTADLQTQSMFINDKWALSQKWSFNFGVRYDQTSGVNQARVKTSDDSRISPRLGAIYDVTGEGIHRVSLSYGRYAAKIDGAISDTTSPAGRYATYVFRYNGPALNTPGTPVDQLLTTDEVLRRVFAWFQANGGANPNSPLVFQATVPGQSTRIDKPLHTPYMDEITLGYGLRISGNGYVRGDLIHRTWGDFYVIRTDMQTGRTADGKLDVGLVENGSKSDFERNYNGVQFQGAYKLFGRFNLGGNYTWSKLRGNVEGEEFNNATIPVGVVQPGGTAAFETPSYPEYTTFDRNRPTGYLMGDIRHRANLWVQFDAPVPFGQLSLSALERYHTGQSFSATAPVVPAGITNPGYLQPPSAVQYYFSDRGAYRLDDITSTDLNVVYSLPITKVNFFVKADLINVFNEQGVEFVENPTSTGGAVINKTVTLTSTRFNPKTETPVLGTHYTLPAAFGQPVNKDAYQLPRTYRFAVGVKF
ncbi:MAG TPA: TonB-dependent receptor, partial [Thermoanaerobaculia bacterium]